MARAIINLSVAIEDTEDFLKASDVIYEKMRVDERGLPQDFSYGCPYAVLSCYTIESGIKNLLIKNNIEFHREHDLLNLFNLLPDTYKKRLYYLENALWNQGIYKETPEEIFNGLLEKTKGNFIDARYFFEKKPNNVEICVVFLKTTAHAIFDLLKEEN